MVRRKGKKHQEAENSKEEYRAKRRKNGSERSSPRNWREDADTIVTRVATAIAKATRAAVALVTRARKMTNRKC